MLPDAIQKVNANHMKDLTCNWTLDVPSQLLVKVIYPFHFRGEDSCDIFACIEQSVESISVNLWL